MKTIQTIGELKIYVKELEDGGKAVAFANFGREKVKMSYNDLSKFQEQEVGKNLKP